jgi:hypothetical protein
MAFWNKTPGSAGEKNPYRLLDPVGFDKGAKVNRRAEELRRFAAEGLTISEALTAIGAALGNAVAAMHVQPPNLSIDEASCPGNCPNLTTMITPTPIRIANTRKAKASKRPNEESIVDALFL